MLVMSFVLRHKLAASAMQDLLTLLNLVIPGCVPNTSYFMQKYFCFDIQNVETHYYCPTCLTYIGAEITPVCASCGSAYDSKDSYMLTLPIELQLRQLFEQNYWDAYMFDKRKNVNTVSDVCDGGCL